MKKSWKPQVRSFFVNRVPFWIFLGFCTFAVCWYFCLPPQNYKMFFIVIFAYLGSALFNYYYVKRWDKGGFEKITIDTNKKLIIFDDKYTVNFENIVNIEYTIENNPNIPLIFRTDIYDNGRIDILKINATLLIQTNNGKYIHYSIQNKHAAKSILKALKCSGFDIDVSDERTLNLALTIRIIIVIVCLTALAVILQNR